METGAEMALTVPPRENPDPSNLCAVTAPRSPCLASLSPGRASELWKAPAHALALVIRFFSFRLWRLLKEPFLKTNYNQP